MYNKDKSAPLKTKQKQTNKKKKGKKMSKLPQSGIFIQNSQSKYI